MRLRKTIMKSSRAVSWVKWLNGEKTSVSNTIPVLVRRVLIWIWLESESSFATDLAGQPSLLRLGFEPPLGLMTGCFLLVNIYCFVFSFWSVLSAEMMVSPFVYNICFCNIYFFIFYYYIFNLYIFYVFHIYIFLLFFSCP
jgi:hypothetical protein